VFRGFSDWSGLFAAVKAEAKLKWKVEVEAGDGCSGA
jgi:hypothetical protein